MERLPCGAQQAQALQFFGQACWQGPVLVLPLALLRRPCRLPGTVSSTRTGAEVLAGAVERPAKTCLNTCPLDIYGDLLDCAR